jgi:hypothetical protein
VQVTATVRHVLNHELDGVNFDLEAPLPGGPHGDAARSYTTLVRLTAQALRAAAGAGALPTSTASASLPADPISGPSPGRARRAAGMGVQARTALCDGRADEGKLAPAYANVLLHSAGWAIDGV